MRRQTACWSDLRTPKRDAEQADGPGTGSGRGREWQFMTAFRRGLCFALLAIFSPRPRLADAAATGAEMAGVDRGSLVNRMERSS